MDFATLAERFGLPLAMFVIFVVTGYRGIWEWGYQVKRERDRRAEEDARRDEQHKAALAERDRKYDDMLAQYRERMQEQEKRRQEALAEQELRRQEALAMRDEQYRHIYEIAVRAVNAAEHGTQTAETIVNLAQEPKKS